VHNPGAALAIKALQEGFQDGQGRKRMSVQASRRSIKSAGAQQIRYTDSPPSDVTRQVS
jgi:hypothetical protein